MILLYHQVSHNYKSSPEEPPFYLEAAIYLPNPDNALLEKEFVPEADFFPIPILQPHSVNLLKSKRKIISRKVH